MHCMDVHPCPTSENTWPTTAVYLQTLWTALVVSRVCQLVSWETEISTATAKATGLAGTCHVGPFAVDDWGVG